MFIRTKCDWKQTYFYLVESYRDKEGRPRQHSIYLGTTMAMSVEQWVSVHPKVEEFVVGGISAYSFVYDAVRAYCKKHGLLLKTAETVRAAARLIKEKQDAELAEKRKQLREAQQRREREQKAAHEKKEREERWTHQFRFVGSDMVSKAFSVLGVSARATREEVKAAFRKAARLHHPDFGGDPAKFRAVAEAKETLYTHLGTT
jgi:hypothetical protein